jgi:hypothetical protein
MPDPRRISRRGPRRGQGCCEHKIRGDVKPGSDGDTTILALDPCYPAASIDLIQAAVRNDWAGRLPPELRHKRV